MPWLQGGQEKVGEDQKLDGLIAWLVPLAKGFILRLPCELFKSYLVNNRRHFPCLYLLGKSKNAEALAETGTKTECMYESI